MSVLSWNLQGIGFLSGNLLQAVQFLATAKSKLRKLQHYFDKLMKLHFLQRPHYSLKVN